ncbi:MAG: response regulator [Deltaproteobacteria bacterium]|nr:MAG: response regulator [Deltaproteobacteria bacterium]
MVCYRNCATRSPSPCAQARGRLLRVAEGRQILIVDDDEDTRTVLQDLLELNGYAVRAFPDARRAIDAACALRPALMLVDYFLPDANGVWLVQQLRDAGLGQVPVVLTTGSNEGREQAERLGVRSMEKPFDVSRLLELVKMLVPGA